MRKHRDAVIIAALLSSLAALVLVLRPHASDQAERLHLSTYRQGPFGARALYLLTEGLGLPSERQLEPWTAALPAGGLILLAPIEPPTPREVDLLIGWIRGGGTLLFAALPVLDNPVASMMGVRQDTIALALGLRVRSLQPGGLGALATVRWEGMTAYPQPHPWATDAAQVPGFTWAFAPDSPALSQAGTEILYRTAAGEPTSLSFPLGAGRVVAWSDPAVLGNRPLRDNGAALLFARAATAAVAAGGVLLFDEYHQGYRESGGPFTAMRTFLTSSGPGRAVLQAAAAGLLLLLLAGTRLGEPVREAFGRRRSPLEHVEALASAYRRAGARGTARRLLLAGLDRQFGRRAAAPAAPGPGGPGAPPLAGLAADLPAGRRLIQEWERGESGDLVALATAIDDFMVEVRRWE